MHTNDNNSNSNQIDFFKFKTNIRLIEMPFHYVNRMNGIPFVGEYCKKQLLYYIVIIIRHLCIDSAYGTFHFNIKFCGFIVYLRSNI